MSIILNPVEQFFDLDGKPLADGYIYLGDVNGNPETNPVQVYWDNAFTIPAAQPIRTVNGYPVRAGTPAPIFSNVDVSMMVRNKKRLQVFYSPNSSQSGNTSNVIIRTSNIELVNSDNGKVVLASGSFTQTFDASVALGSGWSVTYANVGNGTIIFDPNLTETIDGFSTETLRPGDMCIIYCDGVNLTTSGLYSLNVTRYNITNDPILNGYVDTNTNANTVIGSIKHISGADPSPERPVWAVFRDPTIANPGFFIRTITAATTMTMSSGSTGGTVSNQASRCRWVLVDSGAGVVLGFYNSWDNTNKTLLALDETGVYTTTAEGGAGAADSALVIYTTNAQVNKAIREAGYFESTQTTAGTWAQTITKKVTVGLGCHRTGDILQNITVNKTDTDSTTSTTFVDFGGTAFSKTVTAQSAANLIDVSVYVSSGQNGAGNNFFQILKDAAAMLVGDVAGSRLPVQQSATPGSVTALVGCSMFASAIINAATTTIKPQWAVSSGTGRLNFTNTDTNAATFPRGTSSMSIKEIFV